MTYVDVHTREPCGADEHGAAGALPLLHEHQGQHPLRPQGGHLRAGGGSRPGGRSARVHHGAGARLRLHAAAAWQQPQHGPAAAHQLSRGQWWRTPASSSWTRPRPTSTPARRRSSRRASRRCSGAARPSVIAHRFVPPSPAPGRHRPCWDHGPHRGDGATTRKLLEKGELYAALYAMNFGEPITTHSNGSDDGFSLLGLPAI